MPENIITSTSKKHTSHTRTSRRRQGVRLTAEQRITAQNTFLETFASTGNVRASCMKAGVDRSAVRQWEEHDTAFSVLYNQAKEDVNDAIRAEIFRRGMYGEEEIITSMGKPVYEQIPVLNPDGTPKLDKNNKPIMRQGKMLTQKRKSDVLLMFHAKSRMPEYRDKGMQIVNVLPKEYVNLPDDDGVDEEVLK